MSSHDSSDPNEMKYPFDNSSSSERARLLARKSARKRPAKRIARPGDIGKSLDGELPFRMNAMERFFAALLRSSPLEFFASETSDVKSLALWQSICQRVGLSAPTDPIQAVYENQRAHFEIRAALVLEEARAAISQPLARTWKRNDSRSNPMGRNVMMLTASRSNPMGRNVMMLTAHLCDQRNSSGHPSITFHNRQNFTRDELFQIRPGSIFQCIPRECPDRTIHNIHLGAVVSTNRDQVENKKMFTCLFFRETDLPPTIENTEWVIAPLCHLISELRAFEAMTIQPGDVSFLMDLMGKQRARHTRFRGDSFDENIPVSESIDCNLKEYVPENKHPIATMSSIDESSNSDNASKSDDDPNFLLMVEALRAVDQNARVEEISHAPLILTEEGKPDARGSFTPSPLLNNIFKIPLLNESQENAAKTYLESDNGTITLVQGPPGTGTAML
jgi:hypothetical protein